MLAPAARLQASDGAALRSVSMAGMTIAAIATALVRTPCTSSPSRRVAGRAWSAKLRGSRCQAR
jgi:hypothetical protein